MKKLLRQLHREVFILDCLEELPEVITIEGFSTRRVDDHTLEVEVQKGQHLNPVFAALDAAGIHISSMRNRANRLEEMFVNLVEGAA
jgi:ABC-2 type transport system ATP-binding protein